MQIDNTPEASLSDLFLSLSAAALTYLGQEVVPGKDKPEVNLLHARHTISTLEMLKLKTEGNRTEQESSLLDELLYQLRTAFIRAEAEQRSRPTPPDSKAQE